MRMSTWIWVVIGLLILPLISAAELPSEIINNFFPLHENNIDLAVGTPVCLNRSNIPKEELHWLAMPSNSSELATNEYYGYLSGQLIKAGVVNASDCPLNGLWPTGYANSCGLEKTHEVSLYLQNVYDDEILAAGKNVGVPPLMIKQLIRYESQFWPVQIGFYHFGLGHLTYAGAQNALIWSRDLYEAVLAQSYPGITDLATELLSLMDASCPACTYKINIPKAEKSINYIAQVLMGFCKQTSQVVSNATDRNPGEVVSYATIWKLTLLNYNGGPMCVYDAVRESYHSQKPESGKLMSWASIASQVDAKYCLVSLEYVESITGNYYEYEETP